MGLEFLGKRQTTEIYHSRVDRLPNQTSKRTVCTHSEAVRTYPVTPPSLAKSWGCGDSDWRRGTGPLDGGGVRSPGWRPGMDYRTNRVQSGSNTSPNTVKIVPPCNGSLTHFSNAPSLVHTSRVTDSLRSGSSYGAYCACAVLPAAKLRLSFVLLEDEQLDQSAVGGALCKMAGNSERIDSSEPCKNWTSATANGNCKLLFARRTCKYIIIVTTRLELQMWDIISIVTERLKMLHFMETSRVWRFTYFKVSYCKSV